MPYNPSVNDRSGEIYGNAGAAAAEIRRQGNVAAAQAVSDAVTNISQMYMQQKTKSEENKMTSDYLDQMANFYNNTPGPDGKTKMMSDEDLEKFTKSSLGAKQGMIAPRLATYDQMMKNSYLDRQMSAYMGRSAFAAQVPSNQVPMGAGTAPVSAGDADPAASGAPAFAAGIQTRPAY